MGLGVGLLHFGRESGVGSRESGIVRSGKWAEFSIIVYFDTYRTYAQNPWVGWAKPCPPYR
ncbi:MAG: hypothetical protein F6K55_46535 [Moorea sp. SIO4A3]|nr:hypothetical protein [Moorena sp. SIO4A3]